MGKSIIEEGYARFEPVGQDDLCASCPSSCKTSCARIAEIKSKMSMKEDFKEFAVKFNVGEKK